MISGLPRPATTGSASCAPAALELAHQRQRIDLALQRQKPDTIAPGAIASGNGARRDRLGGLRALGRRQRIAPHQRVLADDGFQVGDGVGHLLCAVVMPAKAGIQ